VFADADDEEFLNFLKTVVDKGRGSLVPQITVFYRRLMMASKGIAQAVIETAFPIDGPTMDLISAAFEKRLGMKGFSATVRVLPELVGGMRVIIGSTVYDGTARSNLNRLHEKIAK
jgi:F-type H+-transporting ATPase subunit delta